MPLRVVIIGAGITGLSSAIALNKYSPSPKPTITIVEIRSAPSTIGGAVNLTPKALRYLDHLGVLKILQDEGAGAECKSIELFDLYTGSKTAELDFKGRDGDGIGRKGSKKYFAMRIMRWQLQKALLQVAREQAGCEILFGKETVGIEESAEGVCVDFADGQKIRGDLLLGCDGIHSCVRGLLVDRERKPTYTGIATSMATSRVRQDKQLRWETTGLISSRRGSFMASYFERTQTQQYIAVVLETEAVSSREGWRVKGSDQAEVKRQILSRFDNEVMPELRELIEHAGDWTLYPVYSLPPGGRWISPGGKCILLGDAAHAVSASSHPGGAMLTHLKMPPQGESTGICIEDAIVFARCMVHQGANVSSVFQAYENIRRSSIDAAYQAAVQRWENVRDKGYLAHRLMLFLTPWYVSLRRTLANLC